MRLVREFRAPLRFDRPDRAPFSALVGTLLLLPLWATAHANGLGGLAAGALFGAILSLAFVGVWLGTWAAIRGYKRVRSKRRGVAVRETYWLKDTSIPIGLRFLTLLQYLLAFGYAYLSFVAAIFSDIFRNGHGYLIHSTVFGTMFAVLLIVVAGGIIRRSRTWGYYAGMWLGGLAWINAVVYWLSYSGASRFARDWVSPSFGVILIVLLATRYYGYFGANKITFPLMRSLKIVVGAGTLALVSLASSSFVYTSARADKAERVLDGMADAILQYREQTGRWPATLDDIDPAVKRSYRFHRIRYDRDALEIRLDLNLEWEDSESSLLCRCSYRQFGQCDELLSGVGRKLEQP